ncbi:MAG: hypothetical protein CALGDGBN_01997 [Pseudomonadales bacterium]|nr:hypothetical protein [Pseudomonadales bacterium]
MDINDLFDGIMKSINQFADEIAEQQLQEKMQESGRGPENGGENAENFEAKEKRGMTDFPKKELSGQQRRHPESGVSRCQYAEKENPSNNRTRLVDGSVFFKWWRRRQSHRLINQYVAMLNAKNAPIDTPR